MPVDLVFRIVFDRDLLDRYPVHQSTEPLPILILLAITRELAGNFVMKIVFISNYFNHHQRPLSDALYAITGGDYCFIETAPMRQERKQLGYGQDDNPVYVKTAYLSQEASNECLELVLNADVLIAGSAPEKYLRERIRAEKLTFRYYERPLKHGKESLKYLPRLIRWNLNNPPKKPVYLLAASAFAAADYAKFGMFREKAYQWGYFPATKRYSTMPRKDERSILWVGRFLNWKHPDDVLLAAAMLRNAGYIFKLNYIGNGEMEEKLHKMASTYYLEDCVHFLGAMRPELVRAQMEAASIFIFSSDRQEGWGAVVNEAMNSGCAVVASDAAGSVPCLICNHENGLIYHSGHVDELCEKMKYLLDRPEEQQRLGKAAYDTIQNEWNAEEAAKRIVQMTQLLLSGETHPNIYETGPCSRAKILRENWFVTHSV